MLNEIQGVLSERLNKFLESAIICYKGWKRYPRKTKKLLKKSFLWNFKNYNRRCENNNEVKHAFFNFKIK